MPDGDVLFLMYRTKRSIDLCYVQAVSISILLFYYFVPMDAYVHKRSCLSQQSESPQP